MTNPAQEAPATFGSAGNSTVASNALSALSSTPNATQFSETPINEYFSANPTIMANAWQLPQNMGSTALNSGVPTGTPASPQARADIAQAVKMLDLYAKFEAQQPLSTADIEAASQLGGPIARAAQLLGKEKTIPGKPGQPGHEVPASTKTIEQVQPAVMGYNPPNKKVTEKVPAHEVAATKGTGPTKALAKGTQKALIEANREIATRLESTVGLDPAELTSKGLNAQVPKAFASKMQNAGYGVTQTMTLSQALGAASGQGPQGIPGANSATNMTVGGYLQSMAHMTKAQIYQLQQSLFNGGFYDPTYTDGSKSYTQGVLDVGTIEAMRQAILMTLQQNANGTPVSLEQVINNPTKFGGTLGGQGALAGATKSSTVPMATSTQTQQPLINAFVAALGRNPSQAELDAFTSTYNTELQNSSKTLTLAGQNPQGIVDYQSGIPFVQGTPTVTAAAQQYAENQNPVEYQAHNVANAFGMLMNVVDRRGVSALDTPGTRPTGTT